MFKESILGKLILALISLLKTFKYSFTYKALSGFKNSFSNIFKSSVIYNFFYNEGKFQSYAEKSVIIRLSSVLIIG